ncbi:MAG: hypothetical protein ACJ8ET_06425, partial [Sphingomicrobium sp.]
NEQRVRRIWVGQLYGGRTGNRRTDSSEDFRVVDVSDVTRRRKFPGRPQGDEIALVNRREPSPPK